MSSEQNPNNYDGATVTIVGRAGSEAKSPAYDKDGSKGILELSVAVSQGYKSKTDGTWVDTGTTWYNYTAAGDYAKALSAIGKGDKVRIDDGKLETREFDRKDGTKGQAFNVSYGNLTVVESKSAAPSDGFTPDEGPGGFI